MRKIVPLFLLLLAGCGGHEEKNIWDQEWTAPNWNSEPDSPPNRPVPRGEPARPGREHIAKLLELHNYQRELKGRPAFVLDEDLNAYAQKWAEHMAGRNKLYHSDVSNVLAMGKYYNAGENIAWNQTSPEEVTNSWMNSSGHRANILNRNFNAIGFGLSFNENNEPYWVTVFGG